LFISIPLTAAALISCPTNLLPLAIVKSLPVILTEPVIATGPFLISTVPYNV